MENKDWREELKNLCKMQNIGISPNGGYIQELWYRSSHARLESLIEMILKSKQEEMEKKIEEWKPIQWDEQSLAEMKQDLKELLSNK